MGLDGFHDLDVSRLAFTTVCSCIPPVLPVRCRRGVITGVEEHGVLVSLSTSVRGLVPLAHLSSDAAVSTNYRELFRRGMGVRVVVRKVDEERKGLILSLKGDPVVLTRFVMISIRCSC